MKADLCLRFSDSLDYFCFTLYGRKKIESGILQEKSLLRLIMITPYKQNVIDSFIVLQLHYLHSEGPHCPKKRQEIYSKFGKDSFARFAPFLAVKWLDTPEWR